MAIISETWALPWQHTIKLSDDRGKHTGNQTELDACMEIVKCLGLIDSDAFLPI